MTRQAECICLLCSNTPPTQEDLFCDFCRTTCVRHREIYGTKLDPRPLADFERLLNGMEGT